MILLLGGTTEGREILAHCLERGWAVVATAATEYGRILLEKSASGFQKKDIHFIARPLEREEMIFLIREKGVKVVVDATHPFAVLVSKKAREACRETGIPYIRYCRQRGGIPEKGEVLICPHYEAAAQKAAALGGKGTIFLTVGSRPLPLFVAAAREQGRRVVARVLPVVEAIERCRKAGLEPADIIAMQGPFSCELNKALFRAYQASVVVAKESGIAGGMEEKVQAAASLGIPLVLVSRPAEPLPEGQEIVVGAYMDLINCLEALVGKR